jgi:uncharacterized protein YcnI
VKVKDPGRRRLPLSLAFGVLIALISAASAAAHARISPPVSLANTLQLYSLAVPTEKANAFTTKIVMTVPAGFSIDSFVPSPGWQRELQQTGSGDSAVIQQVTWTGGHVPTEDDSLFQFLAEPSKAGTFTFQVQQMYSDGQIVNWADAESGANPAPTISAKSSLGGGGTSTLTIIALAVGAVGVILGAVALFAGRGGGSSEGGGGRQLA